MPITYLITGSNLGDRLKNLSSARKELLSCIGPLLKESRIYESEPWGFTHPNLFLNQVLVLQTSLLPGEVMQSVAKIEERMGRKRVTAAGYQAREMDIDILFYDNDVIKEEHLHLPHPLLHLRKFCLVPLMEINSTLVHPVLGKTIWELYRECPDQGKIFPFTPVTENNPLTSY